MSSKPRKGKAEKKESPKAAHPKPTRPAGKVPEAAVIARHGQGEVTRRGRGFSMGELSGAAMSPHLASGWGVRLDVRRRSVLQGNVDALKAWGAHAGVEKRVEGEVKKLEEDVVKAAREVKKQAVKVEKEAAKVEKEVEAEAVKAEKAVRRKAKPKARPKKKGEK